MERSKMPPFDKYKPEDFKEYYECPFCNKETPNNAKFIESSMDLIFLCSFC